MNGFLNILIDIIICQVIWEKKEKEIIHLHLRGKKGTKQRGYCNGLLPKFQNFKW